MFDFEHVSDRMVGSDCAPIGKHCFLVVGFVRRWLPSLVFAGPGVDFTGTIVGMLAVSHLAA